MLHLLKSRVKKIKIKEEYTVCSFIEPKVGHVYDIRNVPDLYTMLRVRRGRVVVAFTTISYNAISADHH